MIELIRTVPQNPELFGLFMATLLIGISMGILIVVTIDSFIHRDLFPIGEKKKRRWWIR